MSSATTKKTQNPWTPVKGSLGFFKKTATPPDLADPYIRQMLDDLNKEFKAIEESSDRTATKKFHLYGFARK